MPARLAALSVVTLDHIGQGFRRGARCGRSRAAASNASIATALMRHRGLRDAADRETFTATNSRRDPLANGRVGDPVRRRDRRHVEGAAGGSGTRRPSLRVPRAFAHLPFERDRGSGVLARVRERWRSPIRTPAPRRPVPSAGSGWGLFAVISCGVESWCPYRRRATGGVECQSSADHHVMIDELAEIPVTSRGKKFVDHHSVITKTYHRFRTSRTPAKSLR